MKEVKFSKKYDEVKRAKKGGVHGMTSYPAGFQGEVSDETAAAAIEGGFADPVETKPLSKMTRAELDQIVAAEDIDIGDATTNAAIIDKIEAARAQD